MNLPADKKQASKLKAILLALGIILAGIGGKTGDYYVRPCIDIMGEQVTQYEYDQLKTEINTRMRAHVDNRTYPDYDEVKLWVAICQEELKREGKLAFKDVTGKNIFSLLLAWMEGRE